MTTKTVEIMLKVQSRVRLRFHKWNGMVEVLENAWDKMVTRIKAVAIGKRDKVTRELVANIEGIQPDMRKEVLLEYLKKCQ